MDMEVRETVRRFILENLIADDGSVSLREDTPLMQLGILDSLSTLKLVSFLEERFNIAFESSDLENGGFSSLGDIEHLVQMKLSPAG
jgi:acyl carrier protein